MRQVFLAGEEADERPPTAAVLISNGATEHGVPGLERVEHGSLRDLTSYIQPDLALNTGEPAQVRGEDDPDHDSVWTSTDSTAGRSRTIGAHVSPALAEAYT